VQQSPRPIQLNRVMGATARAALVVASFSAGAQTPKPPPPGETKSEPKTAPTATAPAGNAENGKKLYNGVGCWQCHGYSGQGGSAGPRIAPPMPLAFFSKIVREGRDEMPPYTAKVLSDAQVADIHAFLMTIPKPPDSKTIPLLNQKDEGMPPAGVNPGTSPSQTTDPKPPSSRASSGG
jgi:mono/diheme cytochrome c family protein